MRQEGVTGIIFTMVIRDYAKPKGYKVDTLSKHLMAPCKRDRRLVEFQLCQLGPREFEDLEFEMGIIG
jgi:hypothetical protein